MGLSRGVYISGKIFTKASVIKNEFYCKSYKKFKIVYKTKRVGYKISVLPKRGWFVIEQDKQRFYFYTKRKK